MGSNAVFDALDINKDCQITPEEMEVELISAFHLAKSVNNNKESNHANRTESTT